MTDTITFSIAAVSVAGNGKINAIRVQDVHTQTWFNWDNGSWTTATPTITPGAGHLYIAVWATNLGGPASFTLNVKKGTTVLVTKTQTLANAESFGVEVTMDMPFTALSISAAVTP